MELDNEGFISAFNGFFSASNITTSLHYYDQMCRYANVDVNNARDFFEKAHQFIGDGRLFRLKGLLHKFDRRFSLSTYEKCQNSSIDKAKVLIIGSGPAGLRTAIECIFLGCKSVVIIEKRPDFTRNNIVHLWSFVIRDLIELGAKIFFPKFCTGDLDHISIKLLQIILLKIALLLGVRFYSPCEFINLDGESLRPVLAPLDNGLSTEEFDVIVGATGARTVLPGFNFAEDRRALAIGITANFKYKNTLPEQQATEISGVARQFNAQFFDELNSYAGIDIENLVYYKGDTHYFVCTARKASLLMKGVLINDHPETDRLLSKANISHYNLCNYMRELANICTAMTIPDLEYEFCGDTEDTAIFDFTSSCYAKHASRAIVRPDGKRLLMCLIGDSLRLPFWPEGTGCPRGFLSSYDSAWLIKNWFNPLATPIECIALRECVYGLYSSTKPDVLYKNFSESERFQLEPQARYRQLDLSTAHVHLLKARALIDGNVTLSENPFAFISLDRTAVTNGQNHHQKHGTSMRSKRVIPDSSRNATVPDKLMKWCYQRLRPYKELLPELDETDTVTLSDGMALCCLLHSIRSSSVDLSAITPGPLAIETFLSAVVREFTLSPQVTAVEIQSQSNVSGLSRLLIQLHTITSHAERVMVNETKRISTATKAEKLRAMGRGIRQQRKNQLDVEELLFGGKQLSLEEKKMKLKELFLLGQSTTTTPSPTNPETVSHHEFEQRRSRIQGMLSGDSGFKTDDDNLKPSGGAALSEISESLRDRRELLIRKLSATTEPSQKTDPAKISSLIGMKRSQPISNITGSVDISQTTKKLLSSLSSTCITDEQKAIAAALFEARIKGQRRRPSENEEEELRGPPPPKNVPHLTVGDRKRQLINSKKVNVSRSSKPHPDESAHIPVLELKDRLGTATDFSLVKMADPVEKSQMPISELARRITTAQTNIPVDRRPEYQIVNQDYQPSCYICGDRLFVTERMMVDEFAVHRDCFRCAICRRLMRWTSYAAVENLKINHFIFVCPSHVENNEVNEFMLRNKEIMGEVRIENSKRSTSQNNTPAVEEKPFHSVPDSLKTVQSPARQNVERILLENSSDDEELEGSVHSSTLNDELEDINVDEEEEDEEDEFSESDEEKESYETDSVGKSTEDCKLSPNGDVEEKSNDKGALKIDMWLHQQLLQQRQQKLMAAKHAFLASTESPSLPATFSEPVKIEPKTGGLVMECESDSNNEESSVSANGIEDLAKKYEKGLVITAHTEPVKEAHISPSQAVRGMFSKITKSLDASLAKIGSKFSPKSHTSTSPENSTHLSQPSSPKHRTIKSRPNSVDEMLFGSEHVKVSPQSNVDHRVALTSIISDDETKSNNPCLVKEAEKLVAELDDLDLNIHRIYDEDGKTAVEKKRSGLVLRAKLLEAESEMDALMQKYVNACRTSSRDADHSTQEQLMHQIAVLAENRDSISNQLTSQQTVG